jgi:ribosomal protein S18 acetylase RimI-like enzyme
MDIEIIKYFLPAALLENFIITKVEEVAVEQGNRKVVQIELEERLRNPHESDIDQYESKGFYPVKIIKDFPIRGKEVNLAIKRRR